MRTIKLLKAVANHAKGTVLRVWESGPVERGMVDAKRAAQWVKDRIAAEGEWDRSEELKPAVKARRSRKAK